jgi:peptide/nickel transport system permease protein
LRLVQAIPALFGISVITFGLVNLMPSDPVAIMLGPEQLASEEVIEATRERYGLDQPVYVRYWNWLVDVSNGDLGASFYYNGVPVTEKIMQRLPATLLLVLFSFAFSITLSIPLGIVSAVRRNEATDHAARIFSLIGVSTPSFWIGLILIIVFGYYLEWLPVSGLPMPTEDPAQVSNADSRFGVILQTLRHLILPTIALGTLRMAAVTRIQRSTMLEILNAGYIDLVKAYGVSGRTIMRKHAFKNAQLPVITIIGLQISGALGGSVLIETVFNIPGLGRLIITAIEAQDYPLIMGTTLFFGFIFIIGVIVTDIAYAYIDPRVSYGGEA